MTDRILQGVGSRGVIGTELNESLPNITGGIGDGVVIWDANDKTYGVFTQTNNYARGSLTSGNFNNINITFDASRSSSTYQNNAPVQQNALCITYIIKI